MDCMRVISRACHSVGFFRPLSAARMGTSVTQPPPLIHNLRVELTLETGGLAAASVLTRLLPKNAGSGDS